MTGRGWVIVSAATAVSVILAVALVISLAGDGHDDPPGPPGLPSAHVDAEAMADFRQCLEGHDIEPPGAGDLPSREDVARMREAYSACQEQLPEGAPPFLAPGSGPPESPHGAPPQGFELPQ